MISTKRITIQNFRCFKSLVVDFEHCHALIGENGAGKTAVLDAIDLVTSTSFGSSRLDEQDFNSSDDGAIRIELELSDIFWVKLPDGYTTQAIPSRSVVLTAKRREKASAGRALTDPFVTEHVAVPVVFSQAASLGRVPPGLHCPVSVAKTEKGYSIGRKSGNNMEVLPMALSMRNELVGFPNVFCFDKDRERQAKVGFSSLLQKIARDLNWRFRSKWNQAEVIQAWDSFYKQVVETVEDPKNGRVLRPLQSEAAALLGRDFSDLELSLLDVEQPFSKTFLARRTGSNQIEHTRLGSGVSILLAYLLLNVISSLSKEATIYLIDEPELHLHPQLQFRLFERFRESPSQTIYTTQSDAFVDVAEWRAISRFSTAHGVTPLAGELQKQLDDKLIAEHLDEIKPLHQQHVVFRREDNQLFFARKCLLVEGPAEHYGLPILAGRLKLSLGEVTLLSCNGKSKIPYYQLLCKAFGIPYFTLCDLDDKPRDHRDNKRPLEWADQESIYVFESSFESLLGLSGSQKHKGSSALLAVDALEAKNIPPQIVEALEKIAAWSGGPKPAAGSRSRRRVEDD